MEEILYSLLHPSQLGDNKLHEATSERSIVLHELPASTSSTSGFFFKLKTDPRGYGS